MGTLEVPAQQYCSYSASQAVLLLTLAEGRAQMGLPGRGWAMLAAPAPSCLSCPALCMQRNEAEVFVGALIIYYF